VERFKPARPKTGSQSPAQRRQSKPSPPRRRQASCGVHPQLFLPRPDQEIKSYGGPDVELSFWKPPCRWWLFPVGRCSAFSRGAGASAVASPPAQIGSAKTIALGRIRVTQAAGSLLELMRCRQDHLAAALRGGFGSMARNGSAELSNTQIDAVFTSRHPGAEALLRWGHIFAERTHRCLDRAARTPCRLAAQGVPKNRSKDTILTRVLHHRFRRLGGVDLRPRGLELEPSARVPQGYTAILRVRNANLMAPRQARYATRGVLAFMEQAARRILGFLLYKNFSRRIKEKNPCCGMLLAHGRDERGHAVPHQVDGVISV